MNTNNTYYVEPEDSGEANRDTAARLSAAEKTNTELRSAIEKQKKEAEDLKKQLSITKEQVQKLKLQTLLQSVKAVLNGLSNAGRKLAENFRRELPRNPQAAAQTAQISNQATQLAASIQTESAQLACEKVGQYLEEQQKTIFTETPTNPPSLLSKARSFRNEANQHAKSANVSLKTARLENQKELSADSTSKHSIDAQVQMSLAVIMADKCAEVAAQGVDSIETALSLADNASKSCDQNAQPPTQLTNALTAIAQFRANSQSKTVEFMKLEKECTTTAEESGIAWGTIGLVMGGVAVVGGAYLIGRNNGKKRGGGNSGSSPSTTTTSNNSNTGNNSNSNTNPSNNSNVSIVGSTDGCEAGKARNLQGQCVTVGTPNIGVGSTAEPSSTQTSTGTVSTSTNRNLVSPSGSANNSSQSGLSSGSGVGSSAQPSVGGSQSSGAVSASGAQYSGSSESAPSGGDSLLGSTDANANSGPVTESQLSGGNLYPLKIGNRVKYLSYKNCIKNAKCRAQNRGLVSRERLRLERLKKDSKFLD